MAILAFQKPDKVIMLDATETFGRFEFRPLEPGYGITIGNALRRILLSSLEGFAITSIRIEGVAHEFDTIPGVIESVIDIVLNLKQVRFKRMIEDVDGESATIEVSGKQEFTAEDISKHLSSFKVLNPELHICSMEPTVKLMAPAAEYSMPMVRHRISAAMMTLRLAWKSTLFSTMLRTPMAAIMP